MSQTARDLVQSRTDTAVTQSTLRELVGALIGASVRDQRGGL